MKPDRWITGRTRGVNQWCRLGMVAALATFILPDLAWGEPPRKGPGPAIDVARLPKVRVISPNGGERFESTAAIRVTWEASTGAMAKTNWYWVLMERVVPVGQAGEKGDEVRVNRRNETDWISDGFDATGKTQKGRKYSLTLRWEGRTLRPGQYKVTVFGVDHSEFLRLTSRDPLATDHQLVRDASVVDTCDRSFTVYRMSEVPPAGRKKTARSK